MTFLMLKKIVNIIDFVELINIKTTTNTNGSKEQTRRRDLQNNTTNNIACLSNSPRSSTGDNS